MAMLEIKRGKEYIDTDDIAYVVDIDPEGRAVHIVLENYYNNHLRYNASSMHEKQSLLKRFPKPEC